MARRKIIPQVYTQQNLRRGNKEENAPPHLAHESLPGYYWGLTNMETFNTKPEALSQS